MRVVIQRVSQASVTINNQLHDQIAYGLLVLVGITQTDTTADVDYLCQKIVNLRIFDDQNGVMNLSLLNNHYPILVISQFTLHALTKKGNRPSYIKAANPEIAIPLYITFKAKIAELTKQPVHAGVFGANMQVQLINDGPVTIVIDSHQKE